MKRRGPLKKPPRFAGDPTVLDGFHVRLREYLEWCEVKGLSERTVRNHRFNVGYFVAWCEERGVMKPQEVTRPILERYQRHLFHFRAADGRPLSFRTQNVMLSPLKPFFRWLTRQNFILYNPASEMELPKTEKRLPRAVLTASEAEAVINKPNVDELSGLRDRAILETLYSTGIRRQEVCNLAVYDIDEERGTLMVRRGKNRKDRVIPIGDRAIAWIKRYLIEVRPRLATEPDAGALFLMSSGDAMNGKRLGEIVKGYVDASGITKHGACHLFRHTMATLMLEGGADIRFIQAMLGHAALSTTDIYTQVSIKKLKEVHTATHPARLERGEHRAEVTDEARAELDRALADDHDDE